MTHFPRGNNLSTLFQYDFILVPIFNFHFEREEINWRRMESKEIRIPMLGAADGAAEPDSKKLFCPKLIKY